jgi:hypothetical protein
MKGGKLDGIAAIIFHPVTTFFGDQRRGHNNAIDPFALSGVCKSGTHMGLLRRHSAVHSFVKSAFA